MADATANPRTEIRLTRFPSSSARAGDLTDAIVPLALSSQLLRSREELTRWATPLRERRVVLGRHTATLLSYEVQVCRMRGLTDARLCRRATPQGNSPLRVKPHIPSAPQVLRDPAHEEAPPG
ncbi:hypothetical protein GCM10010278_30700 [Streptomyces melanogenes]|nr:hypothetical protein GCM10010278_30700 [Streptomyces melanogenes]